jgi:cytochrome b6-f complex iron-sulfur subunit
MADEPKGSPLSDVPGPAESPAASKGSAGGAETPAATAETFKTAPSAQPVPDSPAIAGGTNAPKVAQPQATSEDKPTVAFPKPANAAVAEAAAATGTTATASGTEKAPAPAKPAPAPAAKPAAAKAAPATPATPADSAGDMSRRGFFSWAAVAWVGFTVAIGGCVTAMGRFMFPNVLFEPPTSFKVGQPEDFPAGVVDTRFVDKYGVWVVNDGGRIYALIAICTHLGCPPAWLDTQNKFKCPCHGSGYYKSGVNFEGPTPRPLERARVFISPDDGQIVIDKAQKYQFELGQWEDPNSFIPA